jgi:hypothetical protein
MALLGLGTLWAGVASWRRNAAAGLHERERAAPGDPPDTTASHRPE